MSTEERHFKDEIHEMLDRRLSAEKRAEVESHVRSCDDCRRELEVARFVKEVGLQKLDSLAPPPDLESALRSRLVSEAGGVVPAPRRPWVWRPTAAAAAALVLVFVLTLLWRYHSRESLPELVASDFTSFKEGRLSLEIVSSSERQVESFFGERGVPFPTRVFDFQMMSYEVMGGRLHRLRGRASALFGYRSGDGRFLLCQMYEGRVDEIRGRPEVRVNDGIRFLVYRVGGVTVVFWQEGGVACALASDQPLEDVVQLAFAKAVRI